MINEWRVSDESRLVWKNKDMLSQTTLMTTIQDEDALTTAYLYGVEEGSKRIKLLEQRVIDLQGHDDLSYIDKKLSEQEGE